MNKRSYLTPKVSPDLPDGPLSIHIPCFAQLLSEQGYAKSTTQQKLHVLADLDQWLRKRRMEVEGLNEQQVTRFVSHCRLRGHYHRGDQATLHNLLKYLRGSGVTASPEIETEPSPIDCIATNFAEYLTSERGLRQATIKHYILGARQFLFQRFKASRVALSDLCQGDVTRFVLRQTRVVCPHRAQVLTGALRSFLRFLYARGDIGTDLAAVVPTVANRRFSELPRFLMPEQVEHLLQNCKRSTAAGRRDYAILLLLARLGLRAGDLVHMELHDIDWDSGELVMRGKVRREDRLPLPKDAGEALAEYLRHGRPRCSSRRVFIRLLAPHQGFSSSVAVCDVVRRALARAGLHPAFKGAHLLRHSLATRMLRGGASLTEIGEILRHQSPNTTQIYAKVDLAALRTIAQPWPGGEA